VKLINNSYKKKRLTPVKKSNKSEKKNLKKIESSLPSESFSCKAKSSEEFIASLNSKYPSIVKAAYNLAKATSTSFLSSFLDFLIDEPMSIKKYFASSFGQRELSSIKLFLKGVENGSVVNYVGDDSELRRSQFVATAVKEDYVECFQRGRSPLELYRFDKEDVDISII